MKAEITVFTKPRGPLTKRIHLVDGKISNDSSDCLMISGSARRVTIELDNLQPLAELITNFAQREAYALGRLRDGLPDRVKVVTADKLDEAKKGDATVIARTKDHLVFVAGEPGIALIDVDQKGIPEAAKSRIKEAGGIWAALCAVVPSLAAAAYVMRPSTSAGLRNKDTGETYPESGGFHAAVAVADAADIPRFLSDFHDRLWFAGYGWGIVSAAGSFLERSLVDKACGSPERLIFEGPPSVERPLEQAPRPAVAHEGVVLDTRIACPPLTDAEKTEVGKLKEVEELRLLPERRNTRAKWSIGHIKRMTAAGVSEADARAQVDSWIDRNELSGDFPLPFDDPRLAGAAVADLLKTPKRYVGQTLADPYEGPAYGRGKAIVYQRNDGSLLIHSFAHGGATYELRVSPASDVEAAIERLARLKIIDYERVRVNEAKRLSLRPSALDRAIKARRKLTSGQGATAPPPPGGGPPPGGQTAQTGPAPSAAARPMIALGPSDTERSVNEVERLLIASGRGLYQRGGLIVSTSFTIAKTWDAQDVKIQIIEERGDAALAEDMEAVADFSAPDKYGVFRPVNPPKRIVSTLKDRKSRLRFPILTAIVNCPSISADGKLLEDSGYDPATGILFDPLSVAFPRVPQLLNQRIAAEALARIKRPFETFPFADDDSRAVALSGALTAVARRGLPFTPIHAFDAPVAGAGKGKIVDIFCIIATGRRAGVMAQGKTDEEFDKALGAVLMRGDPMIAIDNCSRPVESDLLNMTQTQEFVEVRLLGHSIMVRVPTKAFTTLNGNNLAIVGDLIRRTLICRLDPKTERPELLQFDFDPIAHTVEHRPQLVVDVLTVLKAYHNAGRPNRPPRLQSFEHWSDTVRGALIWLGEGDPVKTMERMRSADATLAAMGAVFSAWRDHFHFASVSAADVIARAEEYEYVAAPVASGGGLFPPKSSKSAIPTCATPSCWLPKTGTASSIPFGLAIGCARCAIASSP